jgi:hypothetical protein
VDAAEKAVNKLRRSTAFATASAPPSASDRAAAAVAEQTALGDEASLAGGGMRHLHRVRAGTRTR